MAQLVQSFVGDTALRLQNEEFVRQMHFGTNWTQLRIGLWMSIPQGTGTIFSPTLYAGLCQGTADGYKSSSTAEWVGWRFGQGTANWTYNAGPPDYYSTGNARQRIYKIGAVTTTAGSVLSVTEYVPIAIRAFYGFDFLKTTTGYSLASVSPGAIPTVDITEPNFLMSAHADIGSSSYGPVNFATNNLLDSLSLYWDFPAVGIEFSSILVVRVI